MSAVYLAESSALLSLVTCVTSPVLITKQPGYIVSHLSRAGATTAASLGAHVREPPLSELQQQLLYQE